jgi:hypothetical protein
MEPGRTGGGRQTADLQVNRREPGPPPHILHLPVAANKKMSQFPTWNIVKYKKRNRYYKRKAIRTLT